MAHYEQDIIYQLPVIWKELKHSIGLQYLGMTTRNKQFMIMQLSLELQ